MFLLFSSMKTDAAKLWIIWTDANFSTYSKLLQNKKGTLQYYYMMYFYMDNMFIIMVLNMNVFWKNIFLRAILGICTFMAHLNSIINSFRFFSFGKSSFLLNLYRATSTPLTEILARFAISLVVRLSRSHAHRRKSADDKSG